jgi:S1-C subfamily serine protease
MTTMSKKGACSFITALLLVAGCASAPPPIPVAITTIAPRAESVTGYERNSDAAYRIDTYSGHKYDGDGSGIVISTEGYILTANHVVKNDDTISILIQEGTNPPVNYVAKTVATDEVHDLVVLKIERRFANCVILADNAALRPGEDVYAIGYPMTFGQMIARGHVQRLHFSDTNVNDRDNGLNDVALADFLTGPGGSGSGVFLGSNGQLVGVMDAIVFRREKGANPMILALSGFIPVEHVRALLEANRIPYVQSDGTVKIYLPLPTPVPMLPPAAPLAPTAAPPQAAPLPPVQRNVPRKK